MWWFLALLALSAALYLASVAKPVGATKTARHPYWDQHAAELEALRVATSDGADE